MLFNSFAYMIFLPAVVLLYWLMPVRFRTPFLLVASAFFYMYWKPIYGLLILGMTVFNYFLGLALEKAQVRRKMLLTAGVVVNLLLLGFFKYTYFAHDSANALLKVLGGPALPPLAIEIILPLGISFFAFEFIHYIVDVYRGSAAVKSFIQFALFPSFFPTQIAGPIKRFQDFVPQLSNLPKFKMDYLNEGVELVLFGLFKKICIADNIAVVVNSCFAHPQGLSSFDVWLTMWAFYFQVYFDFSGYTDIARGSALMMGFKVPINFNQPMLASSITDFWRRWHISLSTWLRDYLYIPLGGNKIGEFMACRNAIITMTLAGLWHGASATFLVFGLYMGFAITVHRLWKKLCASSEWMQKMVASKVFHCIAMFLTFNTFTVGLIFFRSPDMQVALTIFRKMMCLDPSPAGLSAWTPSILGTSSSVMFLLLPLTMITLFVVQVLVERFKDNPGIMPNFFPGFKPAYLAALAIFILLLAPSVTATYIYFQF